MKTLIYSSLLALSGTLLLGYTTLDKSKDKEEKSYWPNGARLVISGSMQFETGGQPEGADSPFSGNPLPKGQSDLPANSWFRYGATEGVYRMLNLFDKYNVKITSHMVGEAVLKYPEIAKEIAKRGHEVAGHGIAWDDQWKLSYDEELKFVKDGDKAIESVTGIKPIGYNCNWLRRSPNTLKVLQEAGYKYHIDDVSRDEPFITHVRGKNFVVVPYTLRNNDIVNIEGKNWTPQQHLEQLKADFDVLYEEAKHHRRMMSFSLHDRIGGSPAMVKIIGEFFEYVQNHEGVVFMRKDEIAKMVENDHKTIIDDSEIEYNK